MIVCEYLQMIDIVLIVLIANLTEMFVACSVEIDVLYFIKKLHMRGT